VTEVLAPPVTEPAAATGWRADGRAAVPGWLAARGLVLMAWLAARFERVTQLDHTPTALSFGFYAWDGVFYRDISHVGYPAVRSETLRFFPLFPLVARPLGIVVGYGPAVVVLANLFAFLAAALLHRLVCLETGDDRLARYSATALALAPPAFVLAWAYSDAMFLALAIATFLCLRRRQWWWAAALGMAAGATRPTGALLAAAAAIEVSRPLFEPVLLRWRPGPPGVEPAREHGPERHGVRSVADLLGRAAAVAAPVAGAGAFLVWVGNRYGDWRIPLDIQDQLRGGKVDPVLRLWDGARDLMGVGHSVEDGFHFPFAVLIVVLVVLAGRRLPASYTLFSAGVAAVAIGAQNLNSVERYGLNAFPIVIAAAWLASRRPAWTKLAVAVTTSGFAALCALAWVDIYVP
jgi:Mannosyltransferase (PIG-V)